MWKLISLKSRIKENSKNTTTQSTRECFILLEEVLKHVPHTGLMQRPELAGDADAARSSQPPYLFACTFYDMQPDQGVPSTSGSFAVPFATTFENLISIITQCSNSLMKSQDDTLVLREVLSRSLTLIERLIARLATPTNVSWDPSQWLKDLLQTFELEVRYTQ